MKQFFLISLFSFIHFLLSAQVVVIEGFVKEATTGENIVGATVEANGNTTTTDVSGFFELNVSADEPVQKITIYKTGYFEGVTKLNQPGTGSNLNLGEVFLTKSDDDEATANEDRIPIIVLDNTEQEGDDFDENISGLLSASNDVFLEAAAFNLSAQRFRIRGYDSENMMTMMNGIPINELESGRVFWSQWGGLNDAMRVRETDIGLKASSYGFGGITGITSVNTRASYQRVQKRFSYYTSNRAYRQRIMGTWSTGLLPSGWAFTFSGSRRWAEEGYLPGTYYDAWAYFLSVDKNLGEKHSLNLTAFGAPNERGRPGSSTQEVYDLVDKINGEHKYFDLYSNTDGQYYNPHWGWQNGKKRNSRVNKTHQPIIILRHDWEVGDNATLTSAASYQFGRYGNTRIDWFNAPDPRPDYYRKLPSYFALNGPEIAAAREQMFLDNPRLLQLDFDAMIEANRLPHPGFGNEPGQWSQYIIEEQRYDSKEFNFNTNFEGVVSENLTMNVGAYFQRYNGHNYKTVADLLGGDYYVNINKFVDLSDGDDANQFDLNNPNRILREGDVWGYNYEPNIWKSGSWAQAQFSFSKVDAFVAANFSRTRMWKTGNYRNGFFPDNSYGDSEKRDFFNYGLKAGLTYKVNNQYYLFANTSYRTRAPFARNAWLAPRTRHDYVPGLTNEKITAHEGGIVMNTPFLKARATAYFTNFENQVEVTQFFARGILTDFGSYVLSGIDKVHSGIELAVEAKINSALRVSAVAALGKYIYTSTPNGLFTIDSEEGGIDLGTIFIKNFRVPGTPQKALSASVNYNGKFWFAEVTANYFDDFYIDFSPERRTSNATFGLDENEDFYRDIVDQSKAERAVTVDLFGGKSFKVGNRKYIYLTIGISNLLNNRKIVSGGFEQLSFDRASWQESGTNFFPSRLYYAFGTNFFAMVSYRW